MSSPNRFGLFASAWPAARHMQSSIFDVRHPEMIKVLRSHLLIFKATSDMPDVPDEWESVSLLLIESISHLDSPVH
jgi:hypothetical protein